MLSVVKVEPNLAGTIHSHPEEQWGFLLEGEWVRIQGAQALTMKACDFCYIPCGVSHGIRTAEIGATVLDIFSPPREEYKKLGEGFSSST